MIDHARNNAVVWHDGEGFRGFRLLVDRDHGRALDVSYWDDRERAPTRRAASAAEPAPRRRTRSRTEHL